MTTTSPDDPTGQAKRTAHVAAQVSLLNQLAAVPTPPDIQRALAGPGVSRYRRAVAFRVVEHFTDLAGPESGLVDVPSRFARVAGETVDVADDTAARLLYRRLLNDGSAQDQAQLVNAGRLQQLWSEDLAEPVVMRVWEERFPQLRG